jgi:hypothetical protein
MKLPPDIELSEDFLRLSSASTNDEGNPKKPKWKLINVDIFVIY